MFSTIIAVTMLGLSAPATPTDAAPWVASWTTSPIPTNAEQRLPQIGGSNTTVRQIVRLTLGGRMLRVRFTNRFGTTPLRIAGAHIAIASGPAAAAIDEASDRALTFGGNTGVEVPPGADFWSDPVSVAVKPLSDLAISTHFAALPDQQTGHPGARTRSWIVAGDRLSDATLADAKPVERWFQIAAVEVTAVPAARAIVALGDSITDGYGVTEGRHLRWTDGLARRLSAGRRTAGVAVLNHGIGGNCLLAECSGPNALARFDSDVASQPGACYVILLEGVNDLGRAGRERTPTAEERRAQVQQMIAGYRQIAARARALKLTVIGGTITPFVGNDYYHPDAAGEAARQAINSWIRTPGHFDAVIDFDAVVRDPARPDRLLPAYDSGDHLHPSMAGYRAMADAVPLALFAR
ncbi:MULTISPECIES: SGNH/GDSL hydrolase family protein [unclassified Sphingomonas]|uniref:SGNH/GDSL hydrolase family protein n=1 Tax=unclassified Sphingomonas TaxID=196159 RepID=UPI000700BD25|nr:MULTISPECIES: SGNH/GDSL hydrolase family protein [unclassified Sphingomonas]KQM67043.1 GDSL family lipase [Sphingomonas sp. Leaf16]KQN16725.1 GDSL family lipase [Sphingomonas sp. Leaf29]KQN23366.1 GDSL family lipase [Sphingomonas sp. Leaf32]